MHLTRIHAIDYGALSDVALDDLGPGLNLVFGRNEAGKSTLTALVRHVLYDFPRRGGEASDYLTPTEAARAGSLTFADAGGSWLVERTDSRRAADREARVTPLGGSPVRPGLLAELTAGTNGEMFRAVFGFGLDELADFERLDSEALRARLYTAGAGLGVSALHALRDSLAKESAELLAARSGKARINNLAAELSGVRGELARVDATSGASAAQRERLDALAAELNDASETQLAAGTTAERLSRLDVEAEALAARVGGDEAELAKARTALDRLDRGLEGTSVDDGLLEAAPEIDALAAGLEAFELNASNVAEADTRIRRAREELSAAVAQMGPDWDLRRALAVRTDGAAEEEVATFARRLADARARWDLERRRAEDAVSAALRADAAAAETAVAAGVPPGTDAADAVRERLAAVDALMSARLSAGAEGARPRRPAVLSAVVGVVGVAAVAAGLILGQYLASVLGVLLGAVAAYMYLAPARIPRPAARNAVVTVFDGEVPSDAELPGMQARLRAAADAARAAAEARGLAELAVAAGARLEAEHSAVTAEWDAWLAAARLSGEPAAVQRLLRVAAEAKARRALLDTASADSSAIRASLDAFAVRATAAGLAAAPATDPMAAPWIAVSHGVRGTAEALRSAREADMRRRGLRRDREAASAEVARLTEEIVALESRRADAVGEANDLLADARLPVIDGGEGLAVSARLARAAADTASEAYQGLFAEKAGIEALLRDAERETRGAELRQREAAVAAELADAVDRYAVVSVASALLARAQRAYEAERQPALVKRAGELFSRFTCGRYAGLAASLGDQGGLTPILAEAAGVRTPEQLSRGTREQLYLAVRLAFIAELGDTGRGLPVLMDDVMVDFDDERKIHVAQTLAEFAEDRQIVLFTCHEATAALFERVAPKHTRRDLDRC